MFFFIKIKVTVCFQTSSVQNGILKLYLQDIKGTIVSSVFFLMILFPDHELVPSRGIFTFYNVGYCVFEPDISPTGEGKIPLKDPRSCRFSM